MTFALSPGAVGLVMVQRRTVTEKVIEALASSPSAIGVVEVLKMVSDRHVLMVAAIGGCWRRYIRGNDVTGTS